LTLEIEPVALRDRSRTLDAFALGRLQIRIERDDRSQPEGDLSPDSVAEDWKTNAVLAKRRSPRFIPSADPWRETDEVFGKPVLRAADLASQMAETYDVDLIADGYRYQRLNDSPESLGENLPNGRVELPLHQALKRCIQPKSSWELRGEILHLRRKRWYEVRLNEIPTSVAGRWSQRLHRKPQLTLTDLLALLELRDGQLQEFAGVMRERGVYLGGMFNEQVLESTQPWRTEGHLLRAVAALPTLQLAQLASGQTLRYADLPLRARAELRALQNQLDRTNPGRGPRAEAPGAELTLSTVTISRSVTRSEDRKRTHISYTLQPPADPAESELWKTFLNDGIPDAPGLRPFASGNASGVRLTFGAEREEIVGRFPLPWAIVRDLAAAN
jgi:hypothetical protein